MSAFSFEVLAKTNGPQNENFKAKLEIKKLELEIAKLENENETSSAKFYIAIISGAIGLLTLLWTIYSGIKSVKQRTEEIKNSTISELLLNVSDEDDNKRLWAIRSLSMYVDSCIVQILACAEVEQSGVIRKAIEDILTSASNESIYDVLQANSITLPKRSYLYGRFEKIHKNKTGMSSGIIGLSDELAIILKKNFNEEFKHGRHIEQQRSEKRALMCKYETPDDLEKIAFNLVSIADITGKVIASWLKEGKVKAIPMNGIDLTDCNLYNANMNKFNSSSCLFTNALMRHISIIDSVLTKSDFCNADLLDATMKRSDFSYSNFSMAHLRLVKAFRNYFNNSNLSQAVLSESSFRWSNFSGCQMTDAKLRGVDFKYSIFENSKLNTSEIQNGNLSFSIIKLKFHSWRP
jgi:uncharacterized protein YjbI with pentapeptide repeats